MKKKFQNAVASIRKKGARRRATQKTELRRATRGIGGILRDMLDVIVFDARYILSNKIRMFQKNVNAKAKGRKRTTRSMLQNEANSTNIQKYKIHKYSKIRVSLLTFNARHTSSNKISR